jgi:multicomponent Na+:H+ antiporter subunit G
MTLAEFIAVPFLLAGGFFFLAGTVGLLRFPDTLSRIHALTKADNLGLGFLLVGLAIVGGSLLAAAKLLVIWLLVLVSSSTVCYLVGSGLYQGER